MTRLVLGTIMKFMYTGYCTNGVLVSPKVPRKRFVNTASHEEKKQFKKTVQEIIGNLNSEWKINTCPR